MTQSNPQASVPVDSDDLPRRLRGWAQLIGSLVRPSCPRRDAVIDVLLESAEAIEDSSPDQEHAMKQGTHPDPETTGPVDSGLRRAVHYSPETIAAYAAVIETGLRGTADTMLMALRHLAMMVHCDLAGELRAPHAHTVSGISNETGARR